METPSSESFIQKHLQTYLWSWKHTEDRLYLLSDADKLFNITNN